MKSPRRISTIVLNELQLSHFRNESSTSLHAMLAKIENQLISNGLKAIFALVFQTIPRMYEERNIHTKIYLKLFDFMKITLCRRTKLIHYSAMNCGISIEWNIFVISRVNQTHTCMYIVQQLHLSGEKFKYDSKDSSFIFKHMREIHSSLDDSFHWLEG